MLYIIFITIPQDRLNGTHYAVRQSLNEYFRIHKNICDTQDLTIENRDYELVSATDYEITLKAHLDTSIANHKKVLLNHIAEYCNNAQIKYKRM